MRKNFSNVMKVKIDKICNGTFTLRYIAKYHHNSLSHSKELMGIISKMSIISSTLRQIKKQVVVVVEYLDDLDLVLQIIINPKMCKNKGMEINALISLLQNGNGSGMSIFNCCCFLIHTNARVWISKRKIITAILCNGQSCDYHM